MRVFPDTLKNMLAWMRANPQADVAGCNLVDEQGNSIKHVRRFPAVWDQLAIILKLPHLYPGVLKKYLRYDFDYSQAAPVDSIRGGFFLMRAGEGHPVPLWLDERYFLWFEEVDFCRKIKEAGGQVWYTPAAKCIDLVGQSFKQLKRVQAQKYFRASMLEYFRKWHHPWEHRLLRLAWPVGLFITWTGEKLKIKTGTTT
jgi:GT2 family glycosyltransferase